MSSLFKTYLLQKSLGSSDAFGVELTDSAKLDTQVGVFAFCCGQQSASSATFSDFVCPKPVDVVTNKVNDVQIKSEDSDRVFRALSATSLYLPSITGLSTHFCSAFFGGILLLCLHCALQLGTSG